MLRDDEDCIVEAYGAGWKEEAAEEKNAIVDGVGGIRGRLGSHPQFQFLLDSVDGLEVAEFTRTRPSRDRTLLSRSLSNS